jgi:hypothetical protein
LKRYLGAEDGNVVEVVRPNRQARSRGKFDLTEALAAALAALSGRPLATKAATGAAEAVSVLQMARQEPLRPAPKRPTSRGTWWSPPLRSCAARLAGLDRDAQMDRAGRFRPGQLISAVQATKATRL